MGVIDSLSLSLLLFRRRTFPCHKDRGLLGRQRPGPPRSEPALGGLDGELRLGGLPSALGALLSVEDGLYVVGRQGAGEKQITQEHHRPVGGLGLRAAGLGQELLGRDADLAAPDDGRRDDVLALGPRLRQDLFIDPQLQRRGEGAHVALRVGHDARPSSAVSSVSSTSSVPSSTGASLPLARSSTERAAAPNPTEPPTRVSTSAVSRLLRWSVQTIAMPCSSPSRRSGPSTARTC